MATKLSELGAEIDAFIKKHGDFELDTEYYCEDCSDTHEGEGWKIKLGFDNKVAIKIIRLGEYDDNER